MTRVPDGGMPRSGGSQTPPSNEPHTNGPATTFPKRGMAHTSPGAELWGAEEEGEGPRGISRELEGGGVAEEVMSKWREVLGPDREIVVSGFALVMCC